LGATLIGGRLTLIRGGSSSEGVVCRGTEFRHVGAGASCGGGAGGGGGGGAAGGGGGVLIDVCAVVCGVGCVVDTCGATIVGCWWRSEGVWAARRIPTATIAAAAPANAAAARLVRYDGRSR
jgi:hypothetical protein